jgi:hypothetical protein
MKPASHMAALLAALGSVAVASLAWLHYARTHRAGQPGGYGALILGALAVGLLAGAASRLTAADNRRNWRLTVLIALIAALLAALILGATLVWAYGT